MTRAGRHVANTTSAIAIQPRDEVQGQRHFLKEEASKDDFFGAQPVAAYVGNEYYKGGEYWGAFEVTKMVNNPDFLQAAA